MVGAAHVRIAHEKPSKTPDQVLTFSRQNQQVARACSRRPVTGNEPEKLSFRPQIAKKAARASKSPLAPGRGPGRMHNISLSLSYPTQTICGDAPRCTSLVRADGCVHRCTQGDYQSTSNLWNVADVFRSRPPHHAQSIPTCPFRRTRCIYACIYENMRAQQPYCSINAPSRQSGHENLGEGKRNSDSDEQPCVVCRECSSGEVSPIRSEI